MDILTTKTVGAKSQQTGSTSNWVAPAAAKKLRIAIVSDAIAGRNGVGTYYPDLLCHIEQAVDSVQLICPREVCDRSIEWFSLPMPGDATQRLSWPNMRQMHRELSKQDPNVVVIPSLGAFSYLALRFARRRNIPVVVVNHTNFDQILSLYWPAIVSWPLQRGLSSVSRWLIRQAAAVAAMNAESLQEADSAGAKMVRVMGTPLASDFLRKPIVDRNSSLSNAIFVGRLAAEKGIDQLLAAVAQLPEFQFTIVGDGPLRPQVEAFAAKHPNLRYLGWIAREKVLDEIDVADMLILPSTLETFGTVALEALARQRYVLVSRQCGIANWPSISSGLFTIEAQETVSAAISRLQSKTAAERDNHAKQSWQAVRAFNENTIRTWLKFLSDAAGL